jgi:glutaredoxin
MSDKVLTLYWMDGCPHCENNKPAWDKAKAIAEEKGITTKEVEKANSPSNITSFPTMTYGSKTLAGSQTDHEVILNKLGISKGGARRSRRRRINRRGGKSRRRTLRRNV